MFYGEKQVQVEVRIRNWKVMQIFVLFFVFLYIVLFFFGRLVQFCFQFQWFEFICIRLVIRRGDLQVFEFNFKFLGKRVWSYLFQRGLGSYIQIVGVYFCDVLQGQFFRERDRCICYIGFMQVILWILFLVLVKVFIFYWMIIWFDVCQVLCSGVCFDCEFYFLVVSVRKLSVWSREYRVVGFIVELRLVSLGLVWFW